MVILNDTSPKANVPEFSVSELSNAIKRSLEQGFSHVRVRAECGRVTVPKSGHIYLDLKDKDAVINGIIWAGVAKGLKIKPEEGLEVIATGKITTYAGQSRYQIIIESLEPAGMGAILLQLEERKKRLAAEGLFDPAKKKPIPFLPKTVGVITSPTGAVIRDILHRISDRYPSHVLLWRVLVQGDKAAEQIVHAIEGFNAIEPNCDVPRPDVLIVARGGGSIEDLWCFNEENVVRAAANSKIPLISAVGHETDTTLIDYASDLRAPTPTGAAEMAVPVRTELIARVETLGSSIISYNMRKIESAKLSLRAIIGSMPKSENLFSNLRQRLDLLELKFVPSMIGKLQLSKSALEKAIAKFSPNLLSTNLIVKKHKLAEFDNRLKLSIRNLARAENENIKNQSLKLDNAFKRFIIAGQVLNQKRNDKLASIGQLLNSLDYHRTLERGFALVRDENGNVLSSKESAKSHNILAISFKDGDINVQNKPLKPVQGDLF